MLNALLSNNKKGQQYHTPFPIRFNVTNTFNYAKVWVTINYHFGNFAISVKNIFSFDAILILNLQSNGDHPRRLKEV